MNGFSEKSNIYYCTCCAREIKLHPEMSAGYCKYCGQRMTLRSAMKCELSAEALGRLSKEELYGIKERYGIYPPVDALKALAKQGSIPANTLLSLYYYEKQDYSAMVEYSDAASTDKNWDGYFYYAVAMHRSGNCDSYENCYKVLESVLDEEFDLKETEKYFDEEYQEIKRLYKKELEEELEREKARERERERQRELERYSYSSSSSYGYSSGSSISDSDYDDFMYMNSIIDRMRNDPAFGDDTKVSTYDPYTVHDPESFPSSSEIW